MTEAAATVFLGCPDGSAVLFRPPRDAFQARLMDVIPRAPHFADLPAAIEAGLAYGVLPPGPRYPLLQGDLFRPFPFMIDDKFLLARGPEAFHGATLREVVRAAVFVGVVPGKSDWVFYGAAIAAALARERPSVLVKTQRQEQAAWLRSLSRHARVPIEVCGEAGARG
jgi:hypothetical protein